jgi:aryl-alcohol dehydrogenase-like predicted oxidoreductase
MEYRNLGGSGLRVSALSLGTASFGGGNAFFKAFGENGVAEARRFVDLALERGVNLVDTADVYSNGLSEEILGKVIDGRRDRLLISTKAPFASAMDRTTSARHAITSFAPSMPAFAASGPTSSISSTSTASTR